MENKVKSTGMIIDGCMAAQTVDSSGEVIEIEGIDLSTIEAGEGIVNYEHIGEEGKGFGQEVVGKIIYCKKILKESDCENDRQRFYFKETRKSPYVYGIIRLFDGSDHKPAMALAAAIRDMVKNGEKILIRFSIEGTTLKQEGQRIVSSIGRKVAITWKPCNRVCNTGLLDDPNAPEGWYKKSEQQDDEFTSLGAHVVKCNPVLGEHDAEYRLIKNLAVIKALASRLPKLDPAAEKRVDALVARNQPLAGDRQALSKTMTAGQPGGAPSTRTGGEALQVEHMAGGVEDLAKRDKKHLVDMAMKLFRSWGDRPYKRPDFCSFVKAQLPEVSPDFVEHFADIAEGIHIKKSEPKEPTKDELVSQEFLAKARELEAEIIDFKKSIADTLDGAQVDYPRVYSLSIKTGQGLNPAGRFMIFNNNVKHLEDYHGLLQSILPEGPVDTNTVNRLYGLNTSPRFMVQEDLPPEKSIEAIPTTAIKEDKLPTQRPSIFNYQRPGMVGYHTIEFGKEGAALDGQALSPEEIQLVLANCQNGAHLSYKDNVVQKSELVDDEEYATLEKATMDTEDALQHIRHAVKHGHLHPDVERAITNHVFTDPRAEGVGNKYAWEKFKAKNKPGVYVGMDINRFKSINDTYGHTKGDEAIKAVGVALRTAANKVGNTKLAFSGGDELGLYAPSHEHALHFVKEAQEALDKVSPIGGTHRLSISFGLGMDPEVADKALLEAKKQRYSQSGDHLYHPGQEPHFVHSLVPGQTPAKS